MLIGLNVSNNELRIHMYFRLLVRYGELEEHGVFLDFPKDSVYLVSGVGSSKISKAVKNLCQMTISKHA